MNSPCCQQVQVTPARRVEVSVTLMRGDKGDKGDRGEKGDKGDTPEIAAISQGDIAKLF